MRKSMNPGATVRSDCKKKYSPCFFFLPPFLLQPSPLSRLDPPQPPLLAYTGCPFIGRHAMPVRRTFRGYKINLACKTEMERRKRSRNRWRKERDREERERTRASTPTNDSSCTPCHLSRGVDVSFLLLHPRRVLFFSLSRLGLPPFPSEAANLMLGACCLRDTVIYDPADTPIFFLARPPFTSVLLATGRAGY